MRILVTGGSGYVGSHAVRELASAGHEVVIYDDLSTGNRKLSAGFELVEGDIADTAKVTKCLDGVDAVMHFAASAYVGESVTNPRKYFLNNVESGLKLLDAVLATPIRKFVFSSTCATFGTPRQLPISEDCPQEPVNPYGASKLFFEHILSAYSVSHGLRSVALRYFNAAGADPEGRIGECHDPETHLIPLALKAVLGTKPPLTVFGKDHDTSDGTCVRDFIHVTDLGQAHVKAVDYLCQWRRVGRFESRHGQRNVHSAVARSHSRDCRQGSAAPLCRRARRAIQQPSTLTRERRAKCWAGRPSLDWKRLFRAPGTGSRSCRHSWLKLLYRGRLSTLALLP